MLQRTMATVKFLATSPVAASRVGTTPHEVIHRDGPAALRYFAPAEAKFAPVVISMPLINTWYIWDLRPDVSLIVKLRDAGVPVYVIDWGKPGPEAQDRPLSHYIDTVLGRMFDRARRHAGTDVIDAIGYCVGGTFLAAHLARHPEQVRRVAFVATPIDFHSSGRLAVWAAKDEFPVDAVIDGLGNFPGELMRASFQWMKPMGLTRKYFSLWERNEDPAFRDLWAAMERWSNDAVDFPGEAYREYVTRCYFDNALIRGGWTMGSAPVDLKRATMPALVIAASEDHIATPASAFGLKDVWGGAVTTSTIRGGHVGISVGKALPAALLAWIAS